MNEVIAEKIFYDDPTVQIIVFPQQDILTSSGLDLPDDDWD